jgi:hypothetical protein
VMNGLAAGANFLSASLPSSIATGFPNLGEVAFSPQGSAMAVAAGFSSTAAALSAEATALSTMASYERRNQEWRYQLSASQQDVAIGDQQIAVAQDQVRINGQQLNIARMQTENAQATVNYLASKFTNASLYDWMAQVLQGVYQFFLQQATATAQTAQRQLAFERQQMPPVEIQSDYWGAGGLAAPGAASGGNRGMTGAERLVQDIYNLDQWAFNTKSRALQVTKSFSLMRLLPAEFEGLRKNGTMRFATPSSLFDWDFPGHYLRTIRTVRVSVLALVPGVDGIKATLSSTGTSRVVVNSNGLFNPVVIKSLPQTVALTASRDANGVFDLQAVDPAQLLPFEGMGVDTTWRFDLPRAANRMDYQSIADVVVTIEYRAFTDDNYRSQVIRSLGNILSSDRPFSFRNDFADQWWQLSNPEQSETPMTVSFTLSRTDFPPNLDNLSVSQLVMSFSRADGETLEVEVKAFTLTPEAGEQPIGGPALSIGGLVSTRRGNGSAWRPIAGNPPFGTWTLELPDTPAVRAWFAEGKILDILFSITYDATIPAWPS